MFRHDAPKLHTVLLRPNRRIRLQAQTRNVTSSSRPSPPPPKPKPYVRPPPKTRPEPQPKASSEPEARSPPPPFRPQIPRPSFPARLYRTLDRVFPLTQTLHLARYVFAAFLAWHLATTCFYTVGLSHGISMLPTINSAGDWLLISKYYRRGRGVEVGDIVSYSHPVVEGSRAVKRVVALGGDFVLRDTPPGGGDGVGNNGGHMAREGGRGDVMLQVPEGHCYIVGDNLTWSRDSRIFGPLPLALIRGKVLAKTSFSDFWKGRWTVLQHGLQEAQLEE